MDRATVSQGEAQSSTVTNEHRAWRLGDKVTYTNPNGVVFPGKTIIGFCDWDWGHFKAEGYVFLDLDCYWCPVNPSRLKLEAAAA